MIFTFFPFAGKCENPCICVLQLGFNDLQLPLGRHAPCFGLSQLMVLVVQASKRLGDLLFPLAQGTLDIPQLMPVIGQLLPQRLDIALCGTQGSRVRFLVGQRGAQIRFDRIGMVAKRGEVTCQLRLFRLQFQAGIFQLRFEALNILASLSLACKLRITQLSDFSRDLRQFALPGLKQSTKFTILVPLARNVICQLCKCRPGDVQLLPDVIECGMVVWIFFRRGPAP